MKQFRFLSAILILLSYTTVGLGQQKSIKFDTYTIEEGLSQSQVTSIEQDQFGYIWIATQDGLNRFDGYNFTVFKNEANNYSTTTIPDTSIGILS